MRRKEEIELKEAIVFSLLVRLNRNSQMFDSFCILLFDVKIIDWYTLYLYRLLSVLDPEKE